MQQILARIQAEAPEEQIVSARLLPSAVAGAVRLRRRPLTEARMDEVEEEVEQPVSAA